MEKQDAVIFDMDGVLVDTEPLYFEANTRTFRELGFSVSRAEYAAFVGLDAQRMWARLKEDHHLPQPVAELVGLEKDGLYRALTENPIPPIQGAAELLEKLQSNGFTLGLASSSPFKIIHTILEKSGLGDYFSALASGEEVARGKPAPDIFLLAAGRLQVRPPRCTVIEDSGYGVAGAKAAGMKCAAFANPNAGAQDYSSADIVLSDFGPSEVARLFALLQA